MATFSAQAQDVPATGSDFGGVGLIEMRNARFRPDGTLEAGTAIRHQRQFWFLSFQALPFLETTFRLTDRLDATAGRGTTTDRAFDFKARLWEEGPWRPALAVGAQDFIGTGLYSGEYLVASKRLWDFDLTLGMGWGRLGTGADFNNPYGLVYSAYNTRPRNVGVGGMPAVNSLFRGREAAVFAASNGRCPGWRGCAPSSNIRATRCATSAAAIPPAPPTFAARPGRASMPASPGRMTGSMPGSTSSTGRM